MATGGGGRSRRDRRGRRRREKREEKEAEERTRNSSLPEEIIVDILKSLPVESLLRFTTVCRSWYSLITSPQFISLHYKHMASTTNKGVVLIRDIHQTKITKEIYSLNSDDETSVKWKSLNFTIKSEIHDMFFRVVGCVNGVVCLSDDKIRFHEDIVLWNPSIRKFVPLPFPLFRCYDYAVGFGFDDHANDFKVVRVVYPATRGGIGPPKVEIYEPRVGSWREVDPNGFRHKIDKCSPQVFLHGNVHWVAGCKLMCFDDRPNIREKLVVSFDLRNETFSTMEVPDSLNQQEFQPEFFVSTIGESLALIQSTSTSHGSSCCAWVMKQYGVTESWTKLFNVDLTEDTWRVVGFGRSGDALVKANKTFSSLEYKSRQADILKLSGNSKALYVHKFVESLVFLGNRDSVLVDAESSDEDDGRENYIRRCQEPTNPPMFVFWQPTETLIHWFG